MKRRPFIKKRPEKKKPQPKQARAPAGVRHGSYNVSIKNVSYMAKVAPSGTFEVYKGSTPITDRQAVASARLALKQKYKEAPLQKKEIQRAGEKSISLSRKALATLNKEAFDTTIADANIGLVLGLKGTGKGTLYYEIDPKTGAVKPLKGERLKLVRLYLMKKYGGSKVPK